MMTYMWALYAREVRRFQKLWLDTMFSPIVSVGLYLAIFGIVVGDLFVSGVNQLAFIYTGLLSMVVINSSFANPGFALLISKNTGTLIDLQLAPLRPWQVGIAFSLAALTRAAVTLLFALLFTIWFVEGLNFAHPFFFVAIIAVTGVQYGMLGVIFGMWARDFQAMSFMTSFVLQPLIFLGGVFYPISILPAPWNTVSSFNPLHHNINLFRYALLDINDMDPLYSWLIVLAFFLLLFVVMHFSAKYNLRKPL